MVTAAVNNVVKHFTEIKCIKHLQHFTIWWTTSKNFDMEAKPKKWQFQSPPLSTALESGTPSVIMWTKHTMYKQLYTFSHRFPQNWSFFLLFLVLSILTCRIILKWFWRDQSTPLQFVFESREILRRIFLQFNNEWLLWSFQGYNKIILQVERDGIFI